MGVDSVSARFDRDYSMYEVPLSGDVPPLRGTVDLYLAWSTAIVPGMAQLHHPIVAEYGVVVRRG